MVKGLLKCVQAYKSEMEYKPWISMAIDQLSTHGSDKKWQRCMTTILRYLGMYLSPLQLYHFQP